ncbi:carboxypeptidase regulatory-like domain-containing protein [Psychrobium sp. nBUS_13]|uniref:TonB-dependent receptor n=1 Tax=Psychrobium sp. nBUS_13 TaxID=3395319 RepID=UPI003EBADD15
MNSNVFKRSLTAMAVTVSLGIAMPAFADNSSGSIYGRAMEGKTVTIKNPATGFSRSVTVSDSGRFNFPKLPTGKYTVTNGSRTNNVTVTIGTGSSVDFTNVEAIEIVGRQLATIDTSSAESTSVFTAEQIELLPVARDLTSVALLAPGATSGDSGFGNLASFGGSSVAENGYFINGFDVTNIRNFTSFAALPYDAVAQQQVKTGGYGAEYGRSLGGVVNLVTKRGTNEWSGGGSIYMTPSAFREDSKDALSQDPEQGYKDRYIAYRSANSYDYMSYNAYVSGPVIQDELFFFGLFEGTKDEVETFGSQTSKVRKNNSPMYLVKLDWHINDNHLLEVTHINNEKDNEYTPYSYADDVRYGSAHGEAGESYEITSGGDVSIVNYTGFITDDLTASLLWGEMNNTLSARNPDIGPGAECPLVYDRRETPNSSQRIGCWGIAESQYYRPDPNFAPDEDVRESVRFSVEYAMDDHTIKIGYDHEKFTSTRRGTEFSGGDYWRWHTGSGKTVNGVVVPEGQDYIRHRQRNTVSGSFEVENTAFYIEDNWQVNDEWMVYLGLRSEGFKNSNSQGDVFVEASNQVAPRLGFAWDMGGEGTHKVYGTLGRYYIPVASNTNIRASGIEYSLEEYFLVDSADENPTTSAPDKLGAQLGDTLLSGSKDAPDSRTVAVTDLNPMYQDELILGYQQELEDWTVGAKVIYREVKDGMDDYCSFQPFINFAKDKGYDNFDYHTLADCFLMNPGRDVSLAMDLENNGTYATTVVPKEYFDLDVYKRKYQALELTAERPMNDDWYMKASYTLAKSEGNSEGYVNSTNEQEDAGLTQDIDNALFQHGAYGPLPNDRRHTLKVFGAYKLNDEVSISANMTISSGRPMSCQGFVPLEALKDELGVDYDNLSGYGASSYYCNGELTQRGDEGRTPWTKNLDVGLSYKPASIEGLSLKIDVRNILNFQEVTEFVETAESGSGTAATPNPNFQAPINYQTPRRVSFTARYKF